jgi:hypothetical protein
MKHEEKHKGVHPGHREMRATGVVNEAEDDFNPTDRTKAKKIGAEADERKHGGKTRRERKRGGEAKAEEHREDKKEEEKKVKDHKPRKRGGKVDFAKEVEMHGEVAKHRVDRRPRKSGGRTGADQSPFSSARHGEPAKGRKLEMEFE